MKEELIRDMSICDPERQTMRELLNYAQASANMAQSATERWRGQLADNFIDEFERASEQLYNSEFEFRFYKSFEEAITAEQTSLKDICSWLRRRHEAAREAMKGTLSRRLYCSSLSDVVKSWRWGHFRFEEDEIKRLLSRFFGITKL